MVYGVPGLEWSVDRSFVVIIIHPMTTHRLFGSRPLLFHWLKAIDIMVLLAARGAVRPHTLTHSLLSGNCIQ